MNETTITKKQAENAVEQVRAEIRKAARDEARRLKITFGPLPEEAVVNRLSARFNKALEAAPLGGIGEAEHYARLFKIAEDARAELAGLVR